MGESEQVRAKQRYTQRLKEARIGDAEAQYDLALMCANGVGVAQNLAQAIAWATQAAERGHAAAQYLLGTSCANGVGVERELRAATKWLTRAADQGHERAAFKLARILSGDAQTLANEWQLLAAEKGLPEAQAALATQMLAEAGNQGDVLDALAWAEKAAARGHGPSQLALAQLLESGRVGHVDHERVRSLYRAAARHGIPAAQIALTRLDAAGVGRTGDASGSQPAAVRERRLSPKRWVRYAERGTAADAFDLAQMFENGWGIQHSLEQAQDWYGRAAQQGHAAAQFALARLQQSQGGLGDPQRALDWYARAAHQGQPDAQHALARLRAQSASRDSDWLEVFEWCAKAAGSGHTEASRDLAELLQVHTATLARALQLRAAQQGHAQAQYTVGRMYAQGEGVPADTYEACRWFLLAAEGGSVEAAFELALALLSGQGMHQDAAQAVQLLQRAARRGHAAAQWRLGELYASGAPGLEADARKAAALCRKAAQAGFAPAQATLAVLYAKSQSHAKAVQWWEKAHAAGDLESTYNLACACHAGQGHAQDAQRAFALWLQAAQAGLAPAANRVGLCYATADGVAMDAVEAATWFAVAVALGDTAAKPN
ncbi:MAG: sel1 repeat family protein, partial [Rhodoferax sp.]|nr:sel1 repeat family protein [Rhodoferax sp.]